jgi:hypothetical protein
VLVSEADGDGDDGKRAKQAGALSLIRQSSHASPRIHLFTHFCLILANHSCDQHNHDFVSAVVASGSDLSLCLVHIRPSILPAETVHQCPS